ncbi:uncharacterized protein (TIGR02270 family) [Tahibacter aquaticus]|uniref:Uncharacterized protein (TIGR02270 family) n=1 Tax=Tahibacter aquaticus TaxID=520092 RepID=A0A4V3DKM3_9GAMM|nr:HEAT repeat domain-containing protein [Tahibacter aquaticus]TDR34751.1 uncharacterized protein (TIGR02270 family) [Tahibacter aquaticus]
MNLIRPAVWAVLEQHLEDAAFCWLRRQDALWSPLFSRDELGLVDRVLDAHLEGLRVAGAAAIAPALENLERWQTPDEAFVSTYVLAHTPAPTALAQLEGAIGDDEELATGAAAALLWAGSDAALPLLQRWWNSSEPALRHAALPAAMRHPRVKRSTVVLDSEEDADPWLRARAYRVIGEWRLEEFRDRARRGLDDIAARCRFEAAAALSLLGDAKAAERIEEELPALQGRTRRRAVLAWAGGVSSEAFALGFNRLAQDPALHRDLIWALAFRGDAAGLSQLAWWLQFPAHARLAAYAISHVTGMDLEEEGLWQEDAAQADDGDEEAPADDSDDVDEDDGLLDPDTAGLAAWVDAQGVRFLSGHCYLGGEPLQTAVLRDEQATLPQLWQRAYRDCRRGDAVPLTQMCSPVLE